MKVSICIPQYNRVNYLLRSLSIIEQQDYNDIEIVISDDCSTDNTVELITQLTKEYKYPIIFSRNEKNEGYDRNYRKCIELASGEYVIVIGNDDSINGKESISWLVKFLQTNDYPDIGFCNMLEERTGNTLIERAIDSGVIGSGPDIAVKHYSCFSFVGGLIYKKSSFIEYNTSKYDGSIYAQMYLGVLMISSGCKLFSIQRPLVLKDLLLEGKFRNSYRDRIAKKWSEFKIVDGGLPSVMNVLINALADSNALTQSRLYYIFRRIYIVTFPHWVLDYKENHALPEAVGLIAGMAPHRNKNFRRLNMVNRISIISFYSLAAIAATATPVIVFTRTKSSLYKMLKK
jgi:glycosyltransferase involved in cell wall biosynthesis